MNKASEIYTYIFFHFVIKLNIVLIPLYFIFDERKEKDIRFHITLKLRFKNCKM